eukprot:11225-Eustigmatos_ZCMA.PRE.1
MQFIRLCTHVRVIKKQTAEPCRGLIQIAHGSQVKQGQAITPELVPPASIAQEDALLHDAFRVSGV